MSKRLAQAVILSAIKDLNLRGPKTQCYRISAYNFLFEESERDGLEFWTEMAELRVNKLREKIRERQAEHNA